MCGLAGRFHRTALAAAPEWRDRASALLAHRGPDGLGYFRDDRCELVHRRLALIDLSEQGRQPLANEDGSINVVFNGEIYGYQALRSTLRGRGHLFRGSSDTEVLVHLYEDYGEQMVAHLRGMFAFAIYDRRQGRLLLARDRFGIKPLFYARHQDQWLFASEMKAILAFPGFVPQIDRQAVYDFIGLGYVPEPATGFAGIQALPKGTTLCVDAAGERLVTFHRVSPMPLLGERLPAAAEDARDALQSAIVAQSVADVPVAALLSGGIDSSLVVAAHSRVVGRDLQTFNVSFPDPGHDETALARSVAAHCGTNHRTIDAGACTLTADAIFDLLRHFDQPFADTSCFPMYWISRCVREHGIVCTLSGDGADEAFGGYARFWRANRLFQLGALPDWMLHATGWVGTSLASQTQNWGRQVGKAVQLAKTVRHDTATLIADLSSYITEGQKAALVRPEAGHGLASTRHHFNGHEPPGALTLEELSRRLTDCLFRVSLPSDMLRKVDMMSMRASIEVRVPMLDEELVAVGLALPHQLKSDGRQGKRVLRAVAADWLPRGVAEHPKHGFGIPLDRMLSDSSHAAFAELLLSPSARTRPLLDTDSIGTWLSALQRARDGQKAGGAISREGLYFRVFMALSLELWLQEYGLSW